MIVKSAIAKALEGSAPMVKQWLKTIGSEDPYKGLQAYATLSEYVVPKLGRTEVSGPDGDPLTINVVTLAPKGKE